jgi:hypothetical protein
LSIILNKTKQVGDTMARVKTKKEKTTEELQESQDYKDLIDYIFKRIYDTPHPLVYKQIKEFKEQGKTYFGMLHSLIYFYDMLQNEKKDDVFGVGIIEYVYEEASKFYQQIEKERERLSTLDIDLQNDIQIVNKKINKDKPINKKIINIENIVESIGEVDE